MVAGLVSGYDLPKFASDVVLKKGAAQTIVQDLSMTSADVNGHLTVAGSISIGGVDFNDVVTLNATETVMGKYLAKGRDKGVCLPLARFAILFFLQARKLSQRLK